MSDVQQGPDWWLASDGKWYPPQSRPVPPPPPIAPPPQAAPATHPYAVPPPPYPGPPTQFSVPPPPSPSAPGPWPAAAGFAQPASLSPALTGWLQGLMWATAAIAVIAGLVGFAALGTFEDYMDARAGSASEFQAFDDWVDLDDAFAGVGGFAFLLWIAVFVVMLVWMNKAHKATQWLQPGPRKWSSGWTVGAWFIPFANFVIPKMVMNEIERIARAPRFSGAVNPAWRQQSTLAIGWLWWILVAIGLVLTSVGSGLRDAEEFNADDIRASYACQSIGLLVGAVGLAFGAVYMRRVGRRLSPAGMRENP